MPQSQHEEPFSNPKQAANFLLVVLLAFSVTLEVFLRRRFGTRYFGAPTGAAIIGVPLWMSFWPGESPRGILVFWLLFLVMLARARIESVFIARNRGIHSRYNGIPRLARLFKRTPEWSIKGGLEPMAAFFTGMLLTPVSLPLGSYLMTAAGAMAFCQALSQSLNHTRALDTHDALIDQQLRMERFQALRNRDRL